jgi:uncharacterized protein YidB (DUF937 family)
MFDFARVAETIGGWLGQTATASDAAGLFDRLTEMGLDPAHLERLAPGQMSDLLSTYGIDLANFDAQQLQQIADQLGSDSNVAQFIREQLSDRAGSS